MLSQVLQRTIPKAPLQLNLLMGEKVPDRNIILTAKLIIRGNREYLKE